MIATITKRFTFDAAHCLPNLPPGHKCHRLHGHTYEVELLLCGPVDEDYTGFVLDYAMIAAAWAPLHELLDHRYLNDVEGLKIPSTECLAYWIADRLVDNPLLHGPKVDQQIRIRGGGTYGENYGLSWPAASTLLAQVIVRESSTTECRFDVSWVAKVRSGARYPYAHLISLQNR